MLAKSSRLMLLVMLPCQSHLSHNEKSTKKIVDFTINTSIYVRDFSSLPWFDETGG